MVELRSYLILPILLCIALLAGGEAIAVERCAHCPAGCMPSELVDTTWPGSLVGGCPEGCIPYSAVHTLRDPLPCDPDPEPQQWALPEDTVEPATGPQANTMHRLVYTPSAVQLEKGKTTITGLAFAAWEIQHTVIDHLQIGAYTIFPVTWAGIVPTIRLAGKLGDSGLHAQAGAFGGIVGVYANGVAFDQGEFLWFTGGGVQLSYVSGIHMLSLSFNAAAGGQREQQDVMVDYHVDGAYLLPSIGYRVGFHPNWSFQAEFSPLILAGSNERKMFLFNQTHFYSLIYGFRGHGDLIYGDLGFMLPFTEGFVDHVWKYVPLGIPYFSLGFMF